ncbi:Type III pantothenate kinase [Anatilimnocola aggregata]|uniref:Type III pantothenate kinase n=1 Tax=Anatilimnocola aggregata TaxID=2528021 RepID=A0A517Y9U0_9BACT|nr:type III pantothenate kinase [Anatilimnocola aggregata]QDU26961.1 Type III pantothenate kinase [Anatilimnocola aggregata]
MSAAQLIAVDIGNSFAKLGWFAKDAVAANELPLPTQVIDFRTDIGPGDELLEMLPREAVRWRVSSVNRAGQQRLSQWVQQHRPADDYRLLTRHDLPLDVQVDEPLKVGLDRLAAAVAANVLRTAQTPAIVIGAGTAVTVNLLSAEGVFLGGTILAGFRMSAEALFGGAEQLPLTTFHPNEEPPEVVGKNTEAAIRSGLFWGAVGAVREIVTRIKADLATEPELFITGGDLRRLSPLVDERARYLPHMVLSGIAVASRS